MYDACYWQLKTLKYKLLWWSNVPIAIQLNRGISKYAQHESDRGALIAIDAEQRRLVAATHHYQVPGATCVSALQFHRLVINQTVRVVCDVLNNELLKKRGVGAKVCYSTILSVSSGRSK